MRKLYRFLSGVDNAEFCQRVSDALADGYVLYGNPVMQEAINKDHENAFNEMKNFRELKDIHNQNIQQNDRLNEMENIQRRYMENNIHSNKLLEVLNIPILSILNLSSSSTKSKIFVKSSGRNPQNFGGAILSVVIHFL